MTGQEIVDRVGRIVLGNGSDESPTAAETRDIITILRGMLGQWATQRLTIFYVERAVHDLVANQQSYAIGPSGNFNRARPLWIDRASIISYANPSLPAELGIRVLDTQQWRNVAIKTVPSKLPESVYYDYGFSSTGLGTLYVWPKPSDSTVDIVLYLPVALTGFTTTNLTTDYEFPPGYDDALVYNLAKRMAPEFGRPISGDINALALESLANIKRANIRMVELTTDPALLRNRGWNFLTGDAR